MLRQQKYAAIQGQQSHLTVLEPQKNLKRGGSKAVVWKSNINGEVEEPSHFVAIIFERGGKALEIIRRDQKVLVNQETKISWGSHKGETGAVLQLTSAKGERKEPGKTAVKA